MCFDDAFEGFDAYLKANRGLSANTRRAYRSDVEECLVALREQGCVDLNEVTIEDLRLWMAESSKNHARSSMARKNCLLVPSPRRRVVGASGRPY